MDTTNPLASSSFSHLDDSTATATPGEFTINDNVTTTTDTTIPNTGSSTTQPNHKDFAPGPGITISTPNKPPSIPTAPQKSRSSSMKKQRRPLNPYNNISSYSHEATTVPPYALYGIANSPVVMATPQTAATAATAATTQGQVSYNMQYTTKQDPFINSLNDNWTNFFNAVDSTPAYAVGKLRKDPESLLTLPDLSGDWGGDKRLKMYLNNEVPLSESSTAVQPQNDSGKWWLPFSAGNNSSNNRGSNSAKSNVVGSGLNSAISGITEKNNNNHNGYWMKTNGDSHLRRTRVERMFFYNNYVPLILRLLIIGVSIAALVLAVKIFQHSRHEILQANLSEILEHIDQEPSTIMAIVVQSCALAYLLYISYDEFNSQPIGIRNPIQKLRLILLDLLFIIFGSANLSISFNTLYDPRWVCSNDIDAKYPVKIDSMCDMQKGLAGCLFVVLVFWCCNFFISIMRIIHKVTDLADRNEQD
ncbi:hypothetical protein WICPIJ_000602 [Wickerhamomyces pijperi]|uniref:Regulator of phospholipase D SRF1 n=1 Tax=Wickerhamomyces pijperi TaxID=599730 RepID=A0A9P8QCL6_WICPI|nr:hypothetical protein WICPIJ_000602 [Wickerhamomyces pijperi]